MTGICQAKSIEVGDQVFRVGFSQAQSHFPFHSRLVASQKGDVVSLDQKVRHFQFALGGSLQGGLGFRLAVEELIAPGKHVISEDNVRIELDNFLGFFDRLFVFAQDRVNRPRQESVGHMIARIGLRPQLTGLLRLFHVSGHLHIVGSSDKEFLPVTGAIPQLIGLAVALRREGRLSHIAVHEPQRRIRHREFGVDLNGALEKGQGAGATS